MYAQINSVYYYRTEDLKEKAKKIGLRTEIVMINYSNITFPISTPSSCTSNPLMRSAEFSTGSTLVLTPGTDFPAVVILQYLKYVDIIFYKGSYSITLTLL